VIPLPEIGPAATALLLCVIPGVAVAALMARLPAGPAAWVGAAVLLPALLPLAGLAGRAAALLPFFVLPLAWWLRRIPSPVLRAAANAGAAPLLVWRRVWLPLAVPGLAAAALLSLARALTLAAAPHGAPVTAAAALLFAAAAWLPLRALAREAP
jgi:ABC-type spermidine/putrescine transport system permease subunit I